MLRAASSGISRYTVQRNNIRASTSSTQSLLLPYLYPSVIPRSPRWHRCASTAANPPGNTSAQQKSSNRERSYSTSTYSTIPIPDGIEDINGVYLRTGKPDGGHLDAHRYQPHRPAGDAPSLVIVDTPRLADSIRKKPRIINGISEDKHELLATYEACVKVGRIARAQLMLNAITGMLDKTSPLLTQAHNTFLKALLQRALVGSNNNQDSLRVFFTWYEDTMRRELNLMGDATTIALLLQGSLALGEVALRDRYIRKYIDQWKEQGREMKEVFALSLLKDEEVVEISQLAGLEVEELDERHRALYTSAGPKEELPLASIPEVTSSEVKGLSLETIKKSLQSLVDPSAMPNRKAFGQDDEAFRVARQKILEEDALTSAQERWRKDHDELVARGAAPIGNSVNPLLWSWHQALVPLIRQELHRVAEAEENPNYQSAVDRCLYGPFLRLMEPEKVAAIVILEMVRMQNTQLAGEGTKSAHAVMAVGTILQQEYYAQELAKKKNQDIFGFLEKDGLKELFNDRAQFRLRVKKAKQKMAEMGDTSSVMLEWPATVKAKLGAVLISMMLHCAKIPVTKTDLTTGEKITQHQPAVQHAYEYVKGRKLGVLRLHPDVVQKLGTEPLRGSALGRNLPMLVPPLPWLSWNDGGYYYTRSRVVRTKSSKEQNIYVQAASNRGDLDQLFQGLDVLGQTAWRINKPVFDVILKVWNEGKQFASIPPREIDLKIPPEPPQSADPKIRMNWLKEVREIKTEEKNNHSQRCTINLKLEIARAFLFEKFYFPHNVDFRGRAYPIPPNLNHIGDDLSRGLLMFADAKPLGENGLRWLKIHCANLAGYDKASFAERVAFIDEHMEDVYDSADKPLEGRRWWLQAEDPWQCLATCISITEAMRSPDPTKYMCHTPVAQDGTCNGLQHYAALGGDKEGARQVNLQPSDRPQDVYTGVAELVKARIEVDVAAGHPIAKILQGHITRKVVKQSVMTNVYGVTFVGARQQIQKQLEDNPEIPRKEVVKCAAYVARLVFSSIKEVFTGATKIQHWLAMSARMISRSVSPAQYEMLDDHTNGTIKNQDSAHARRKGKVEFMTSVVWTTPLKMAVVQPYRNETSVIVQTNLQKVYISDPTAIDEVNSRKQMTAFPPNFIHSLDATHMLLSAVKCAENGITFAAVHDSFWTHPGQVDNLNRILRDAFVNLHSVDIMEKLKDEFETRYKGYKYLVSIPSHSETAKLIKIARKKYATEVLGKIHGLTVVEDLQWELKRDKLLASEDPAERELGENMLTPSVILNRAGGPSAVEIKESLGGGLGAIDNKRTESVDKDVFSDGGDDIPSAADVPEVLEADQAEHMELDNVEAHEEAIHEEAAVEEAIEEAEDLEEEEASKPKKKRGGKNTGTVAVWMPLVFPPLPAKGEFDVRVLKDSLYFFS